MVKIVLYYYSAGMTEANSNRIKKVMTEEDHHLSTSNDNVILSNDCFNVGIVHHSHWNDNPSDNLHFDLVVFLESGRELQKYDGGKLNKTNHRWWNNSIDFATRFELLKEFIGGLTDRNNEFTFEKYESFIAPVIPALSILCQGYLAVHSDDINEFVRQALDRMCWSNSLLNDTQKTTIQNKKQEVKSTIWWSNVLPENRESTLVMSRIDLEWSALGKTPGKDRDLLNKLINTITDGSNSIDSITVAQAYLSIVS
jgi:hypothetical protein